MFFFFLGVRVFFCVRVFVLFFVTIVVVADHQSLAGVGKKTSWLLWVTTQDGC